MSTRSVVKIIERVEGLKKPVEFKLYHHYDGYPEYLGKFLVNELKELGTSQYNKDTMTWARMESACDVANFLIRHEEGGFELTQFTHVDIEYLYEVDVTLRTITCKHVYCKNWDSKSPRYTVREVIDLEPYKEKEVAKLAE